MQHFQVVKSDIEHFHFHARLKCFDALLLTFGVQCLDASIEAFDGACVFTDVHDSQSSIAKLFGGSSSGQELNILAGQEGSKLDNTRLVRNGNQSPSDGYDVGGGAYGEKSEPA